MDSPDADPLKLARASSFGAAAAEYDRGRPSYPDAAVDWMAPAGAHTVVDVGAGTGKLSALLAARRLAVTAVDPSEEMLAQLRASVPGVPTLEGSAEHLPLPDGSVDLVTAAQAWHWVDDAVAFPEVGRVLRPGGSLSLVWNFRTDAHDWSTRFSEIIDDRIESNEVARVVAGATREPFGPWDYAVFEWTQTVTRAELFDLVASRSVFLVASLEEQARVIQAVSELLDTHPELAGRTTYDLPYRTHCFRAQKENE